MKARHILLVAVSSFSLSGIALTANPQMQQDPPARPRNNPPVHHQQPTKGTRSADKNGFNGTQSADKNGYKGTQSADKNGYNGTQSADRPSSTPVGSGTSNNTGSNTSGSGSMDRRSYPHGYPGGSTTGVYYPRGNYPTTNPSSNSYPTGTTTNNPAPATVGGGNTPAAAPTAPSAVDPDLAAATAELDAAMDELRGKLKDRPDYQAALKEKTAARADAQALHEKSDINPTADTLAIAQRGLDASKKLAEIEREAAEKDDRVIAARARLDAARAAHGGAAAAK